MPIRLSDMLGAIAAISLSALEKKQNIQAFKLVVHTSYFH